MKSKFHPWDILPLAAICLWPTIAMGQVDVISRSNYGGSLWDDLMNPWLYPVDSQQIRMEIGFHLRS